jgi:nitroreductase
MDVYEAIKSRFSIRKYKPDDIPQEILESILEAVRLAPSGKNGQPWKFIVIRDSELKQKLVPACKGQKFVGEAPVVVCACGFEDTCDQKMGGYWKSYPVDIGIAFAHLSLTAVAEGLGTCWVGSFLEEEVRKLLGVPPEVKIVALMTLGYPALVPSPMPRKPMEEIISYDRW